jgi:hypothetical protein
MALAAQDVFAEHLGVISALRDNYARTEDAAALAGLVAAQRESATACEEREQRVKEAIRGAWGAGVVEGDRRARLPPPAATRSNAEALQTPACTPLHSPTPLTPYSHPRTDGARGGSGGRRGLPR